MLIIPILYYQLEDKIITMINVKMTPEGRVIAYDYAY